MKQDKETVNSELNDNVTQEQLELIHSIADSLEDFYKKCYKDAEIFKPSMDELTQIIKTLYNNEISEDRIKIEIDEMSQPWWNFKKLNDHQFIASCNIPMAGRSWLIDTERNVTFLLWLS